jgi:hypothetical protein
VVCIWRSINEAGSDAIAGIWWIVRRIVWPRDERPEEPEDGFFDLSHGVSADARDYTLEASGLPDWRWETTRIFGGDSEDYQAPVEIQSGFAATLGDGVGDHCGDSSRPVRRHQYPPEVKSAEMQRHGGLFEAAAGAPYLVRVAADLLQNG